MKTATAGIVAVLALVVLFLWAQSNGDPVDHRVPDDAANPPAGRTAAPAINAGPAKWDASGRVRCSVDSATFTRTCGFRLVHNDDKSLDIWIRNLAKNKAEYRFFHYVNETFASTDDSVVMWQRKGNSWQVSVGDNEFYLIPDALIRTD